MVNADFLEHQREIGNDLITPVLQFRFPGLTPGDRWCVTAIADTSVFDLFVRLIKAEGYRARYRAPYRPDYAMTNRYLEINEWGTGSSIRTCSTGSGPRIGSMSRSPISEFTPSSGVAALVLRANTSGA